MSKTRVEKIEDPSVHRLGPDTPFSISEAYRTIRTNLMFSLAPKEKKIVVVSSSMPSEGKSTTCANLAIAMAQTSAKVMLVDGDLRKPVQHRIFGVENSKGLSSLLGGFDTVAEAVKRNVVKNLDLLTSGMLPPNPSELLGSKNMEILMGKMSEYYDYILIDSPPINLVTDAIVLSGHSAGILMVVRAGHTTLEDIDRAIAALNSAHGEILGTVVSDVDAFGNSYYKKSGYYYYASEYDQAYRERTGDTKSPHRSSGEKASAQS